jgi:protein dithiol oxidoreductase (disulfide-forming)
MRTLKWSGWAALLLLALATLGSVQAQQQPVPDKDYKVVKPPQPTDSGKKIEVIEFFSYACPHCADFEPFLQDWLKRKPKDVEYRMVPMVFREQWKAPAKLFYTLEAMGVLDQYHGKVYEAIHKQNQQLFTDPAVIDWAAKQGLDKTKFEQIYNSFGIDAKVQRGAALGRAYGVQFTPAMGINGHYWTGPSMVMNPSGGLDIPRFFQVVEQLVAMERAKTAGVAPKKKS